MQGASVSNSPSDIIKEASRALVQLLKSVKYMFITSFPAWFNFP